MLAFHHVQWPSLFFLLLSTAEIHLLREDPFRGILFVYKEKGTVLYKPPTLKLILELRKMQYKNVNIMVRPQQLLKKKKQKQPKPKKKSDSFSCFSDRNNCTWRMIHVHSHNVIFWVTHPCSLMAGGRSLHLNMCLHRWQFSQKKIMMSAKNQELWNWRTLEPKWMMKS